MSVAEQYANRIWGKRDLSAINELLYPEVIIHSSFGDFQGPETMKTVVEAWLTGFPDLIVKNKALISEGDLIVIHWQAYGTHRGKFKDIPPTGKPISYAGVTIYRIKNDKIIEYWAYLDMQHLLNQIR